VVGGAFERGTSSGNFNKTTTSQKERSASSLLLLLSLDEEG